MEQYTYLKGPATHRTACSCVLRARSAYLLSLIHIPSSVLMNIVPAKIAGVAHVVMCTPCNKEGKVNPAVLVAAKEAGADEVYKVGGAQAIAAMAFGTESIPKVDKITGPGNIFVALAKKAVSGFVSIDSIAGPSEILVQMCIRDRSTSRSPST